MFLYASVIKFVQLFIVGNNNFAITQDQDQDKQ